ncbi:hypothetical protein CYMTET_31576, partial [Cymbomonas tetramitiformis]
GDPAADLYLLQGKLLALDLLRSLLESVSRHGQANERFVRGLRQHLCLALLRNCLSPIPTVFQNVCVIFSSLVLHFRSTLKSELGVFFPLVALRPLEKADQVQDSTLQLAALQMLRRVCQEPQALVDLFVNYDCDLDAANLFERTLLALAQIAQGLQAIPTTSGATKSQQANITWMVRSSALQCLVAAMRSLTKWARRGGKGRTSSMDAGGDAPGGEGAALTAVKNSTEETPQKSKEMEAGEAAAGEAPMSEAELFEASKAKKVTLEMGMTLFNSSPVKAVRRLQASGVIGPAPEDVAAFLKATSGLSMNMIGEYLGHHEDEEIAVMHAYVDSMAFVDEGFDAALRIFLAGFRLPGEAQKIDRLMEKFAERYCKDNPRAFKSADTAYILAYAVIMLNTDAHNVMVDHKMTRDDFIAMNVASTIDQEEMDAEFLGGIYDRITTNEIVLKDGTGGKEEGSGHRGRLAQIIRLAIPWGSRTEANLVSQESEIVLQRTKDLFQNKGEQGKVFHHASHVAHARPMLEAVGWQVLAAFSSCFEATDDTQQATLCLEVRSPRDRASATRRRRALAGHGG